MFEKRRAFCLRVFDKVDIFFDFVLKLWDYGVEVGLFVCGERIEIVDGVDVIVVECYFGGEERGVGDFRFDVRVFDDVGFVIFGV